MCPPTTDRDGHGKSSSFACNKCGGTELVWADEITPAHPFGTGYVFLVCPSCMERIHDEDGNVIQYHIGH